jgi:hypothetical protein
MPINAHNFQKWIYTLASLVEVCEPLAAVAALAKKTPIG